MKKKIFVVEEAFKCKYLTSLQPRECAKKVERPVRWALVTFLLLSLVQICCFIEFFQTNQIRDFYTMVVMTIVSVVIAGLVLWQLSLVDIGCHVKAVGFGYLEIIKRIKKHKLRRILTEESAEDVRVIVENRLDEYANRIMSDQAKGLDDSRVCRMKSDTFGDLFDLAKGLGITKREFGSFFNQTLILRKNPFD